MEKEAKCGEVVWFDPKKGWGFIKQENDEADMFVHFSNIVSEEGQFKTLDAGQKVTYVVGENHRGPQAEQVEIIDE